jgi:hypothetical protein
LLLVLTLVLSACGSSAQASNPVQGGQSGNGAQNRPNGRPPFGNQDPNAPLPLASALAVGTIKLDDTAQAVSADEAKQLVPLWEGLQSLIGSDTAAKAEVEGVINQILSTMTADQVSAIKALNLKGSDEASIFSQGGYAFGGPNTQGTPQAGATPDAGRFRGGFRGGDGGGFAFRGGGGFPGRGGPGGFNGGGLPGAGSSGGNNNGNSAAQDARATAQARFTQFEQLGVNPVLVRAVINYLQGLTK